MWPSPSPNIIRQYIRIHPKISRLVQPYRQWDGAHTKCRRPRIRACKSSCKRNKKNTKKENLQIWVIYETQHQVWMKTHSYISWKMSLNRPSYAFKMVFFVLKYNGTLRSNAYLNDEWAKPMIDCINLVMVVEFGDGDGQASIPHRCYTFPWQHLVLWSHRPHDELALNPTNRHKNLNMPKAITIATSSTKRTSEGVKTISNFPGFGVTKSVAYNTILIRHRHRHPQHFSNTLYWSPKACLPIIIGFFHPDPKHDGGDGDNERWWFGSYLEQVVGYFEWQLVHGKQCHPRCYESFHWENATSSLS